jgi:hypothetical protein
MGRLKLYRPSRITIGERHAYEKAKCDILKKKAAAIQAFEDFISYCRLNELSTDDPASMLQYGCSLQYYKLDPGTIRTRLKYILSEQRRRRLPSGVSQKMVFAHFGVMKVMKGTRRAEDADEETLIRFLNTMSSSPERTQLALMMLTGQRNEDLNGTGVMRIVSPSHVVFDVLITKTRSMPEERATLQLKNGLCIFPELSASLQADIRSWAALTREARSVKPVGNVLRVLRQAEPSSRFTSYTFRRQYIHKVIDHFTDRETGYVDWKKVTSFTLHFDEKIVKSVYARTASSYAEGETRL